MQIDTDVEALAATQRGLFTRAQARQLGARRGVVRHRLATGRWILHHPGVYRLVGAIVTPRLEVLAATMAVPGAIASHETAASLLGLPGFRELPVHVTVGSSSARAPAGIDLSRTRCLIARDRRVIDGIPATSMARTLFDVCATVPSGRAERALDNALARRLVTRAAIETVFHDLATRGRPGSALMRRLLDERGAAFVAPESELETRFLDLVREHRLPEPARQLDVGDDQGWIGRVDFAFPDRCLIVEVDGRLAHSSHLDRRADAARDRRLRRAGWTVLRLSWDDVTRRPIRAAARLRAVLEPSPCVPTYERAAGAAGS